MKTLREYIDQLDEISRRDFLKGAGATAGLAAMGATKQAFGQQNAVPNVPIARLKVKFHPDANAYYLSFSKRAGEQGTVVVRAFVDEEGNVYEVALLMSSRYPRLDRSAMELAKAFKFFPYEDETTGQPSRVSTNLQIDFRLNPTPPKNVDQYPNISQTKNAQVSVAEEKVDEAASPDAVARIEELVKYK